MTNKALIRRLQISCLGLDPIDPLRLLVDDVIEALREHAMYEVQRLGQEIEQEPVAYDKTELNCFAQDLYDQKMREGKRGHYESMFHVIHQCVKKVAPPPQRTWVGLTDDEIIGVIHPLVMADMSDQATDYEIAKAIEAKLKEKNT
jgi:hypothetical protein